MAEAKTSAVSRRARTPERVETKEAEEPQQPEPEPEPEPQLEVAPPQDDPWRQPEGEAAVAERALREHERVHRVIRRDLNLPE